VCVCVCGVCVVWCMRVAFVTQHAVRIRRIKLPFAASASTIFFPHYLKNGKTFGEKMLWNTK